MLPIRGVLTLFDTREGDITLIPSGAWAHLRWEGGYQEAERWRVTWLLGRLSDFDLMKARGFLAESGLRNDGGMYSLPSMNNHEVLSVITRALENRRIIAIRKGLAAPRKPASVELGRLAERIRGKGDLSFQGRQYRLVVADDLARFSSRDRYQVVSQEEARAVLNEMAKESPARAGDLREAGEKIGKDWRPPHTQPDGLVLLRRVPLSASSPKVDEPALTPSRIREMAKRDWIEIEVVDQDGEPVSSHYRLELPTGEMREGELDDEGFLGVHGIESGSCTLVLGGTAEAKAMAADVDDEPEEIAS